MRTIEIKLFMFDELSEQAKQKAINKWRDNNFEAFWTDENRQSMENFAEIFPIKIRDWSYGGRGEGVNFYFTSEDYIEELSGQRLATYLWNNYKSDLFKGKYYSTSMKPCPKDKEHPAGLTYKKRYSKILLDNCCVLTGYYMDDSILAPIYAFLNKPMKGLTFKELLDECFDAWVKACNDDIEYQQSDECISEQLTYNEYEFEDDGTRI